VNLFEGPGTHQFRELVEILTDAGAKHGMAPQDAYAEASRTVSDIQGAAVGSFTKDQWQAAEKSGFFWRHASDAVERIRAGDFPPLHRQPIEAAAAAYLNSPLRSQQVDRLLVDLLVAQEYFAYAEHVRYAPFGRRRHPVIIYLRHRALAAAFIAALTGAAILIGRSMSMSGILEAALWLGGVGIFILDTLWATIGLVTALVARARGKGLPTSDDLLKLIMLIYNDLKSDGLISAHRIQEKVKQADQRGVGWPPTLFALLDDIIARSGRF
jgi:hypothetical protein